MRRFRYEAEAGMLGVNIGVAAPMAYFPFTGWKDSFFGDLRARPRRDRVLHREEGRHHPLAESLSLAKGSSMRPPSRRTGACSRTAPTRSSQARPGRPSTSCSPG